MASGVASDVPPDARWDVPVATYAARTDTATIPLSDDLVFDEEAYLDLAYPDSPRADPPVADPPVADAPVADPPSPTAGWPDAPVGDADPVPERLPTRPQRHPRARRRRRPPTGRNSPASSAP